MAGWNIRGNKSVFQWRDALEYIKGGRQTQLKSCVDTTRYALSGLTMYNKKEC